MPESAIHNAKVASLNSLAATRFFVSFSALDGGNGKARGTGLLQLKDTTAN
jgi:hypothetical protein